MMANCHSSIRNPEMDVGGQQQHVAAEARPRPIQYSINNLVDSVHRLERLCWHVMLLWRIIVFLVKWEAPLVTLSFWITSLFICYFMESAQLLASCIALLFLLAGAGHLVNFRHREHHPPALQPRQADGPNASPNTAAGTAQGSSPATGASSVPGVDQGSLEVDKQLKKGKESLAEYRQLMLLAQDWLSQACEAMERVHAILGWEDAMWSPAFYGGSFVVMVMLYLLPLRWFVMASISCILGINRDFAAVFEQVWESAYHDRSSAGNNNEEDVVPSQTQQELNATCSSSVAVCRSSSVNDQTKPKPEPKQQLACDTKPPIDPNIEHRPLHLCQKSKSLDEAGPNYAKLAAANRNRSSTAPELPTLKLNSAGLPVDVCFLCGTMFSSVLKRRRYCRSCGNQFCQRCCSRKIPRSVFGATSPAAQTEKELVCNPCYSAMTADEATSGAGGATIEEQ